MTRAPKSIEAAQRLLERFAAIAADRAEIEAERDKQVGAVCAEADQLLTPLIKEAEDIEAVLAPWWAAASADLTQGKRKSIELGGCTIGTKQGPSALIIAGDEQDVIDVLGTLRWAKPFLRSKVSLERSAIMKALDGPRGAAFAELGVARKDGEETFFVKPAKVEGARG